MKSFRTLSICISLAVAGCAGTNVTPGPSVANPASQSVASGLGSAAQVRGSFGSSEAIPRGATAVRVKPDKASYKKALYVADQSNNIIKIFTNTYYRELGALTNGISEPDGVTIDKLGNLYVANYQRPGSLSGYVTEYAPGGTSPSFTYDANMEDVQQVAVDRHGNVFEADGYEGGWVNQYFQGVNVVTATCADPGYGIVSSIAVDSNGDVFVSVVYPGAIYEYIGGLSGCNATHLNGINAWDLQLDSNNNLIATDIGASAVDVLAPPYTQITRTIGSGFSQPYGLSVNKKNKLVFVGDFTNNNVTVVNYQTGANIKVLGTPYGITGAISVVDAPNAVH